MKTFALASVAALCCSQVAALPGFVSLIPGASNVNGVDAIGHVDPSGGGPRNAFGQDFGKAGKKWSVDLCYKDSDNDGQFNGAELGDPCCEWVKGSNEKLAYSSASSPGDASSKQNPSIWASVKCANGQDPLTKFQAYSGGGAPAPAPAPTPAPTPAPGPGPAPTTASPSPGGNSTPAPGPDATPATTTATPKVTTAAPKDDSSTSKPSASTSAPTSTTSEASSSSSDADEVTSAPATTGSSSGADTSIDEISTPAPTPSKTPVATTAAPKSSAVRTLVAASAVAVAVVTWAL